MNVTYYTTWDSVCGLADYARHFKAGLEEEGVVVTVVSADRAETRADYREVAERMNGGDIAQINHEHSLFGKTFLSGIVNFYMFLGGIRIPTVVMLHELVSAREGAFLFGLRKFVLKLVYKILFSRAALVLVHVEGQQRSLIEMGIGRDKVLLLPHPVPRLAGSLVDCRAKGVLGLEGKNVVTVFGFVFARKGYETVLPIIESIPDTVLLIAGGRHPKDRSGYFEQLTRKISEMGLGDKVKITGYVSPEEVQGIMQATDIVLAPFHEMSGSGSLSIAAAFHKPILGSDIGPLRELKSQGLGIELFPNDDSEQLKSRLAGLLADRRALESLADQTKTYAERYSYRNAARRLSELYQMLVPGGTN